jgi:hypothetical protein
MTEVMETEPLALCESDPNFYRCGKLILLFEMARGSEEASWYYRAAIHYALELCSSINWNLFVAQQRRVGRAVSL